jgi:hypothetical protein
MSPTALKIFYHRRRHRLKIFYAEADSDKNFERCLRQRLKFLSAVANGSLKLGKEHNFVWFSK